MKSRISFFNPTALRKDITRFWPAWVLYLVMQLLTLSSGTVFSARNVSDYMIAMNPISCGYAFLAAQLLFGDLYNTRLCNALHAFPLQRESWFWTHVTAGVLFALVPNGIIGLLLCFGCGKLWYMGLIWILASMLQYVVYFGIAVFSAMCVGSRFAMALVYGIISFLSLLVYWLVNTLYQPLLYGVVIDLEPYTLFSPVWKLTSMEYVEVSLYRDKNGVGWYTFNGFVGESWTFLGIYVAVGVVLLLAALWLYRRRSLECAGDFLAERKLEPVFQVIYTLTVGAVLAMFTELFSSGSLYIFLTAGILVGFFTGEILIRRTVRVFTKKSWIRFGVLAGVFVLSLVITAMDPMGITRWVPDADDVEHVIFEETSSYHYGAWPALTDPEEIQTVIDIHSQTLADRNTTVSDSDSTSINLTYRLKNGTRVKRKYTIRVKSQAGELLADYIGTPEYILGDGIRDLDAYLDRIVSMHFNGRESTEILKRENQRSLLEAIIADCEAGNMVQSWRYHNNEGVAGYITIELDQTVPTEIYHEGNFIPAERNYYLELRVYSSCENVLKWLKAHNLKLDDYYLK